MKIAHSNISKYNKSALAVVAAFAVKDVKYVFLSKNHCLSKGLFHIQESDITILSEYIFRLLGRRHQLLFK